MEYKIMGINQNLNADLIIYFDADNIEELNQQINKCVFKDELIQDLNDFDLIIIKRKKKE